MKWVSGFANAQGGKIYIGIDDDLTVVGVDNLHKQLEDIPNKIISNTGVLKILQDQGIIRRVGADRGGYWEIINHSL